MSEYQEFTGKTVEEALREARETFGVASFDDLDFEILTPGSRGVLGMGAEQARIIAAPRSALGGAAPRREAAAATPLPAAPARPREERDRDRGERDRGRRGRPEREPERARERPAERPIGRPAERPIERPIESPTELLAPTRQAPVERRRPERGRRERPGRGGRREQVLDEQEVTRASRAAMSVEREEIQAVEASPEALEEARQILEQILRHMGYRASVMISTGETSKLDVTGDEGEKEALGALIGRKGERLSALQHLVNLMLSRKLGVWTRVLVDVEDYRGRRERQLREIALRAAERVIDTGKMLQLEPMPPLERRWVHLALREHPEVTTQSIGDEPQRRVVVLRRPS